MSGTETDIDTDIDIDNYDDNNTDEYQFNEGDLVFNQKSNGSDSEADIEKETTGGGFSVKKAIIKSGASPLQLVGGSAFGEPTTPNLSSYAIPNWAYSNGGYKKGSEVGRNMYQTETANEDEYVSDDLHDRLLSLVSVSQPNKTKDINNKDINNKDINNINNTNTTKRKSIKKTKKLRKAIQSTKKGFRTTKKRRNSK